MHLDLVKSYPNSFKMIAKNVNTHAHGDVHLVVLAHGDFREVKCIFSIDRTLFSGQPDVRVVSG
jgi:hypothetical protein